MSGVPTAGVPTAGLGVSEGSERARAMTRAPGRAAARDHGRGAVEAWSVFLAVGFLILAPVLSTIHPDRGPIPGGGLSAQAARQIPTEEEDRLLREARVLEAQGDQRAAEERLRRVLEQNPGHAAALITLDRILANQGRRGEMLPLIREHLEARPRSPAVRSLQLRILTMTGSAGRFEEAVEEWIEQNPRSLEAYQEAVDSYQVLFGPERALAFIREARERTGWDSALALEAGDALARLGRSEEAVSEWARAMEDRASLTSVIQRIRDLPGDAREPIEGFVGSLEEKDASPDQLRVAARLALDAELEESAVRLASRALEEMDERAIRSFLVQFASRAEGAGAGDAALWAYTQLRDRSSLERERRSLDNRIADLALAAGDTAEALAAWERVNNSLPEGSVERRRSVAATVEVEIRMLPPEAAAERVDAFREKYPDAPELDGLTARVVERLIEAGDRERASEVLEGVEGPMSSLERAYLHLGEGRIQEAIPELQAATRSLAPADATEVLQLVTFLQGAGDRAAALGGRMAALVHGDRVDRAVTELREGADRVSLDDRPGLLALGARLVESRGRDADAAELRARLVERFPEAAETPEAQLRLARYRASQGRREEARTLLEDLILNRPESAVVPEARRELQRVRADSAEGDR